MMMYFIIKEYGKKFNMNDQWFNELDNDSQQVINKFLQDMKNTLIELEIEIFKLDIEINEMERNEHNE